MAVKRDAKGRVVAGTSAMNPGGRPSMTAEQRKARDALAAASPEAVAVIVELMRHGEDEKTRLAAAKIIVDKVEPDALDGEALQQGNPWAGMTPAQLLEIARQPK